MSSASESMINDPLKWAWWGWRWPICNYFHRPLFEKC